MSKTSTLGRRITGAVVGLVAGGLAIAALSVAICHPPESQHPDFPPIGLILFAGLGLLIGATLGAAGGATITQKLLKQRSSFWRALLGAVVGLLAGVFFLWAFYERGGLSPFIVALPVVGAAIVAGAVLGSGWKAKPAKVTDPSG